MRTEWEFTPDETEDPYERGFADKLYEDMEEPQYIVDEDCEPLQKPKPKRRGKVFLRIAVALIVVLAVSIGALFLLAERPGKEGSATHKDGVATILIAGTDESGLRTDALMLLCTDRDKGKINVMSIPRDTKVNASYWPQKINLAYHMNGTGEDGMYWLMDYVRQCVGFLPDGYILVNLDCFIELVDIFGGVEFDVPCDMYYSDPSQGLNIQISQGMQTLSGEQAMGLVRFRSGYAMADLQRVNVQRDFLKTAIGQWVSVWNLPKFFSAMGILKDNSVTDLTWRNYLWLAWSAVLCGTDDMTMTTIPYYLSGDYVCIDADTEYLDLLNDYFNPYERAIEFDDLRIAH